MSKRMICETGAWMHGKIRVYVDLLACGTAMGYTRFRHCLDLLICETAHRSDVEQLGDPNANSGGGQYLVNKRVPFAAWNRLMFDRSTKRHLRRQQPMTNALVCKRLMQVEHARHVLSVHDRRNCDPNTYCRGVADGAHDLPVVPCSPYAIIFLLVTVDRKLDRQSGHVFQGSCPFSPNGKIQILKKQLYRKKPRKVCCLIH